MIIRMRRINFNLATLVTQYLSPKLVCVAALAFAFVGCNPNKTQTALQPPQALGVVLAEEVARAAGANRQVAVISPDKNWGPMSITETAFRTAMKSKGYSVVTAKSANLGDPMKMREVGLKGTDFLEALGQSGGVGAVVSFCGAPLLSPGDAGQVGTGHPPVLVAATIMLGTEPGVPCDRSLLTNLLAAKIIQLVIVDGPDSAAPNSGQGDAAHVLFAQNYTILRSAN